jgi:type I restriction enzyme S subunit
MVSEWHETTIGEQITLQRGFDITKTQQRPGTVPVISSGGISSYHDTAMVKGPGVILGRKGTVGSVFFVEEDYWPHDTTLWIKDFKNNDRRFVYYFFVYFANRLTGLDVGTSNPTLNRNHVHPIPVYWPSYDDQCEISKILSTLDEKIEFNRRVNSTLEQIAQALFKSWFVDFDPVKAKAEGNTLEGIDAETASLFPSAFEEREIETIPKGWNFVSLDQLFDLIGGGTPKTTNPDFWNGDIAWFSVVDTPTESDVFVIDTQKKITQLGLNSSSTRMLRKGVTIISARGTVGKLAVVATPMAMNQSCYALDGKYGDFFTYYSTNQAVATLKQNTHGAVFDTITRDTFKTVKAVLPTPSLCQAFEDSVSPLMRQIETNLRQSRLLSEIRDSLLPKLISGQIRIPNIEA